MNQKWKDSWNVEIFDKSFTHVDFNKYDGFPTHSKAELNRFESSKGPHPTYLKNKMLLKCAQYFQISYISAYLGRDNDNASHAEEESEDDDEE